MSVNASREVKTTCPYCGVGCGVLVGVDPQAQVTVRGDPDHPANFGRLCSKGAALAETLDDDNRLLRPRVGGETVDWTRALDHVATEFSRIIERHGPEAVAFYVSGQLLTEDYYVANKLMKGYIGAANIDTNSRLCMSSAVAGYKRAFGADSVPCCYEDLERAKLIVLAGSNTAWCHPVLFQRIRNAKQTHPDMRVVVIDPRITPSCDIADLHLPIAPGSDTDLFNGLLLYLRDNGETHEQFVANCTQGLEDALDQARESGADAISVAARCGLDEDRLLEFYRLFARTERVVSVFSQGVNQSSYGTDKVNSLINCHLLTGRIGRPGMGPFSLTGQPNAMGGREVGGLANQLAAHMEIANSSDRQRVQRFWQSPRIAAREGLKAFDLFRAIESGDVKAVWIMATNPAVSLPDSNRVRRALAGCDLVVVSDCVERTDTNQYAHVLLPAQGWGEKEGTVTNSERRISRQRAFLPPRGEARPDWWIIAQVAQRMGYAAGFSYRNSADIWREHAALSGFENGGGRDFDISPLARLSDSDYAQLQPVQWPLTSAARGTARLFADGVFFTPERKARFIAVGARRPANPVSAAYPLVLNSGRVRDHWHTMTRTGTSPRLSSHVVEPYAQVHPQDATAAGIEPQGLVRVASRWGELIVRAQISAEQRIGSVFIPMHWNRQFSSSPGVDCLVNPATDPVSGQPEFKHTPVSLSVYTPAWHGFMMSRRRLDPGPLTYWACARGDGLWRYEIAADEVPADWTVHARQWLCGEGGPAQWVEYHDAAAGRYRAARVVDGRLESCLFVDPQPTLPARDWLAHMFARQQLDEAERSGLLSGKPASDMEDGGRTVCACFSVGVNTLRDAIRTRALCSTQEIGECLQAGTNCGSCVPELEALLRESRETETVAGIPARPNIAVSPTEV